MPCVGYEVLTLNWGLASEISTVEIVYWWQLVWLFWQLWCMCGA